MREAIKGAIEQALILSGLAALARRRVRGQTLILAYHNVVPDGESVRGDISLHLPQRRFAAQLDILARLGRVIPLARALDPAVDRTPRFVVTFDDAYAGALSAGVGELRKRGMPGTIFVAPGLLGLTTWWDTIADPDTGTVPESKRDHALGALAGRRPALDGELVRLGAFLLRASRHFRPVRRQQAGFFQTLGDRLRI